MELKRILSTVIVATTTLVFVGCVAPTGLPRNLPPTVLSQSGVITGSLVYPQPERVDYSHVSDMRVVFRNLQTRETFAFTMEKFPFHENEIRDEGFVGCPFVAVLGPGQYEFAGWFLERSGPGVNSTITLSNWSTATAPVDCRAGEIQYIGEICLTGKLVTPVDVMNGVADKKADDDRPIIVSNQAERDLRLVSERYPGLPWNQTSVSMALSKLEPIVEPPPQPKTWLVSLLGPQKPSPPVDFFPGGRWF
jgi:hypothetical protein